MVRDACVSRIINAAEGERSNLKDYFRDPFYEIFNIIRGFNNLGFIWKNQHAAQRQVSQQVINKIGRVIKKSF